SGSGGLLNATARRSDRDGSDTNADRTPAGGNPAPYNSTAGKTLCCVLFHADAPVHARESFLTAARECGGTARKYGFRVWLLIFHPVPVTQKYAVPARC